MVREFTDFKPGDEVWIRGRVHSSGCSGMRVLAFARYNPDSSAIEINQLDYLAPVQPLDAKDIKGPVIDPVDADLQRRRQRLDDAEMSLKAAIDIFKADMTPDKWGIVTACEVRVRLCRDALLNKNAEKGLDE